MLRIPCVRAPCVRACVRAWELMETCGNFVRGICNMLRRARRRVTCRFCVMLRFRYAFFALQGFFTLRSLRCRAFSHCYFALRGVFMLRFYAARRFYIAIFALQGVFMLRFYAARRFYIAIFALQGIFPLRFSRFKVFFHYVFAMQGVFTLRFRIVFQCYVAFLRCKTFLRCDLCAAGRFHTAILRCKAFLRCVFAIFMSQSIHFLSQACIFGATECMSPNKI